MEKYPLELVVAESTGVLWGTIGSTSVTSTPPITLPDSEVTFPESTTEALADKGVSEMLAITAAITTALIEKTVKGRRVFFGDEVDTVLQNDG
jgi:hypothetical protein